MLRSVWPEGEELVPVEAVGVVDDEPPVAHRRSEGGGGRPLGLGMGLGDGGLDDEEVEQDEVDGQHHAQQPRQRGGRRSGGPTSTTQVAAAATTTWTVTRAATRVRVTALIGYSMSSRRPSRGPSTHRKTARTAMTASGRQVTTISAAGVPPPRPGPWWRPPAGMPRSSNRRWTHQASRTARAKSTRSRFRLISRSALMPGMRYIRWPNGVLAAQGREQADHEHDVPDPPVAGLGPGPPAAEEQGAGGDEGQDAHVAGDLGEVVGARRTCPGTFWLVPSTKGETSRVSRRMSREPLVKKV